MRPFWILAACLMISGCLDEASEPEDEPLEAQEMDERHVPEDISQSGTASGADPQNWADGSLCSLPSETCIEIPFTVEDPVALSATLTWINPASDFDLYVMQDGQQVAMSGDFPPETEESLTVDLGAGEYEVWIVPWAVAADQYEFTGTFS